MARPPVLGALAAALVVLALGIVAAVTYDDSAGKGSVERPVPGTTSTTSTSRGTGVTTSTSTSSTTTTRSATTSTGASVTSTTTAGPAASTSTSLRGIPGTTSTASTVRPAVASPEAAANGLITAYRNGDRTQAERFATSGVVEVLFEKAYVPADDPGFQGCRPDGGDFLCTYLQPTVRYDMTAHGDAAGEFRVIAIDIQDT